MRLAVMVTAAAMLAGPAQAQNSFVLERLRDLCSEHRDFASCPALVTCDPATGNCTPTGASCDPPFVFIAADMPAGKTVAQAVAACQKIVDRWKAATGGKKDFARVRAGVGLTDAKAILDYIDANP